MNTFSLTVSSPDGDIFKERVVSLSLQGANGDLAVLAGHIPFVTTLRPGNCKIELEDGSVKTGRVESGLLSVSPDGVTVLSSDLTLDE